MSKREIIVAAGALIVEKDNILLVQEAEEPVVGIWNFPMGHVEPNERIIETIIREAKEETGYDIKITDFIGIYQSLSLPEFNIIIVMFKAVPIGGKLSSSDKEIMQVKWFSLEEFGAIPDNQLFHPEMRNIVERGLTNPQPVDNYNLF